MVWCLKICVGTFCQKMAYSNPISDITLSILKLVSFSRRRKMRHEQAHLMRLWNKLFLWKIHCFKVRRISNSTNGSVRRAYSIGALDAPAQGASFYVEKIKLASKLRELYQKWSWSRPFSGKKSPHIFSDTNP